MSMSREDAIRKVRILELAANPKEETKENKFMAESAKKLIENLKAKFNIQDSEINGSEKKESTSNPDRVIWIPTCDQKKNSDWLSLTYHLLADWHQVQAVPFNDRLGCLFIGSKETILELGDFVNFVLARSKACFDVWKVYIRKGDRRSYQIGFVYGVLAYLKEQKLAKEQARQAQVSIFGLIGEKQDAIALIGKQLSIMDQGIRETIQDMEDNNLLSDQKKEDKPLDANSWNAGYLDGKQFQAKLLVK